MSRIRVAVVDDHTLFRQGLVSLLSTSPAVEVIGEAGGGEEALALAGETNPDVMLLDLSMPGADGFWAIEHITAGFPQVRIVALTVHVTDAFVARALGAGARGYLPKTASREQLLDAIAAVARGEYYVHPAVAGTVVQEFVKARGQRAAAPWAGLTEREVEILKLIAQGRTNREIATALGITVRTVETHRSNLLSKIGAHDRVDIVRFAIRNGLIEP